MALPPVRFILKKSAQASGLILLALIAVLLVLALVPVNISGLVPSADPTVTYEDSAARIQAVIDGEQGLVCDICGTQFMTHGGRTPRAVVLIHGLTNSPRQFQEIGQKLFADGYNVLIPRMPYHGLATHTVSELGNLKAEDLQRFADEVADESMGLGAEITVVGLSGGGTVAADIAQNRAGIHKVVLIAPFFGLYGVPSFVDYMAANLCSRIPDIDFSSSSEPPRESVYLGWSTRGIAEYLLLSRAVRREVDAEPPQVKDFVLMTNANDHTIDRDMAKSVAGQWQAHGAAVSYYEFPEDQGLPHDYIDITSVGGRSVWVYPIVIQQIESDP